LVEQIYNKKLLNSSFNGIVFYNYINYICFIINASQISFLIPVRMIFWQNHRRKHLVVGYNYIRYQKVAPTELLGFIF